VLNRAQVATITEGLAWMLGAVGAGAGAGVRAGATKKAKKAKGARAPVTLDIAELQACALVVAGDLNFRNEVNTGYFIIYRGTTCSWPLLGH